MAKKLAEKEVDINTKLVEELLSKADPSELFGRGGLFNSIGNSKFATRKIINQLFKNSFNKYVVTSHNIRNYQHFYKNLCQNLSKNRFSFTNYVAKT
ncbi:hypothetical protein N3Z16_09555 (plasmid) [Candidatus Megaera polyxenophila]|uniref:hypothetical protein n=1 Tax=Candidatus Megaera polyxenophila TaxID=988779 RepID=UPI00249E08F5|nr:hypothetical protein N3Z16_09555 [Candidatus Megaera polyxenophila]